MSLFLLLTGFGAALRSWNLATHPLWSDEFATLVFSLGHGFIDIPLDQVTSGDRLLESLRVTSGLGPAATLDRLLTESNHPPLYFVLSNLWIHLWQSPGNLVDLGVARSLPALLGTLAIPGMYALGRLITPTTPTTPGDRHPFPWVAAGLMAVSPFGIYLSQETRHYTLGVLWVIASLACWVWIVRHWKPTDEDREALPRWLPWVWLGVNSLGIATHFFIGILLLGQAIALGILVWRWGFPPLRIRWTIAIAGLGTAATTLAWVPYVQSIPKAGLTDWLSETVTWTTGLKAIARLLAWAVTMGVLLPVENQPVGVLIGSALVMALATGAIGAGLVIVWRSQPQKFTSNSPQIIAFASLAAS
ncbi:MAG: glycosyltransferase, partial [Cyanobacteria bacterium P01_H01_bin.130]